MMESPALTTTITLDRADEDGFWSCRADVLEAGELVCNVAILGRFADEAAALEALQLRVQRWIANRKAKARDPAGSVAAGISMGAA